MRVLRRDRLAQVNLGAGLGETDESLHLTRRYWHAIRARRVPSPNLHVILLKNLASLRREHGKAVRLRVGDVLPHQTHGQRREVLVCAREIQPESLLERRAPANGELVVGGLFAVPRLRLRVGSRVLVLLLPFPRRLHLLVLVRVVCQELLLRLLELLARVHAVRRQHVPRPVLVQLGVGVVHQDEDEVEPGEERRGHLEVIGDVQRPVVHAPVGVSRRDDGRARGQGAEDPSLGDAHLLLLHALQERVVLARHLVELVDAAHAAVGDHERASLVRVLAGGWILDDRGGETRGGHRPTAAVHTLVRYLRRRLEHLALAHARVAHHQAVDAAPGGNAPLVVELLTHTPEQGEHDARLDELVAVDDGAERVHQLFELLAVALLGEPDDELQIRGRHRGFLLNLLQEIIHTEPPFLYPAEVVILRREVGQTAPERLLRLRREGLPVRVVARPSFRHRQRVHHQLEMIRRPLPLQRAPLGLHVVHLHDADYRHPVTRRAPVHQAPLHVHVGEPRGAGAEVKVVLLLLRVLYELLEPYALPFDALDRVPVRGELLRAAPRRGAALGLVVDAVGEVKRLRRVAPVAVKLERLYARG